MEGVSNLEYYAVYSRTITIKFTNGGGTGTAPTSITRTQYYNSAGNLSSISFTLPSNTFTRPGYKFSSWNLGNPGATVTITWGMNDATTYSDAALWTPVIYIKQNGSWKASVPQIKVSGVWKTPTAVYVKVSGVWKQVY